MVSLDRCNECCNTLNNPSSRISVPNKFTLITGINEYKILIKHISYKCVRKLDKGKCNPN